MICPQLILRLCFFCWKAYVIGCVTFMQSTHLLHKCLMPRATRQWFSIQTSPMENIAVFPPPSWQVYPTQHSSPSLSLSHTCLITNIHDVIFRWFAANQREKVGSSHSHEIGLPSSPLSIQLEVNWNGQAWDIQDGSGEPANPREQTKPLWFS